MNLTIKFKDNKGGAVSQTCKDELHLTKLLLRYQRRGWKQVVYREIEIIETYPF